MRCRAGSAHPYRLSKQAAWPHAASAAVNSSDGRLHQSQRLSLEDPFETHDSGDPGRRHDVGATLSTTGMARLHAEWARAAKLLSPSGGAADEAQLAALFESRESNRG